MERGNSDSSSSGLDRPSIDKDAAIGAGISERKLMRKIDFRVVPVLSFMYLLAFLDRTNIGNAKTYGLEKDLKLTSLKYNNCLLMFFVSYCVFEIPSNILLKKFRPSRWLGCCMFIFGLVTICTGLVKSYGGLMAARFFLGLAESGMFPGAFYVISMYYKRSEAQKRYSFFFSSTSLGGAFGGLIAYGIGHIRRPIMGEPHTGMEGAWRWIFIIEGSVCCVLAILWFFIIPDFPEDARWLSTNEKAYVRHRLAVDAGKSGIEKPITFRDIVNFFSDYKVYFGMGAYFGGIVSAYAFAYFGATILKTLGYTSLKTQLMSVPPWAASFVFSNVIAYLSDKTRHRYLFCVVPLAISLIGYVMLFCIHDKKHVEYGALFLAVSGTYGAGAIITCWFQCNLRGHARRAIGSAWQVGIGNLGGIISIYTFPNQDAPEYRLGYGLCIGATVFSAFCCTVLLVGYMLENRARAARVADELTVMDEADPDDDVARYRNLY